ncbi:MAG: nucleotidyltransferase domain-containing protein [Melioribacteraceae bacterium]|nr:nucleotidyltransferase domain-containing protein [Melioribacteraceae bacterium]
MIIHNVLNQLFSSPAAVSILRELSLRAKGATGRELARASGITHQAAHNTLSKLEQLNIINREHLGNAHYFIINRKHFLTKYIVESIFKSEQKYSALLFDKIKNTIGSYSVSVILFGSVARCEETVESDLDICIIYSSNKKYLEDTISELREDLYIQFGVTLAPYYITKTDFIKKYKLNKTPVSEIVKEGKLISGTPINRIIHGKKSTPQKV